MQLQLDQHPHSWNRPKAYSRRQRRPRSLNEALKSTSRPSLMAHSRPPPHMLQLRKRSALHSTLAQCFNHRAGRAGRAGSRYYPSAHQ